MNSFCCHLSNTSRTVVPALDPLRRHRRTLLSERGLAPAGCTYACYPVVKNHVAMPLLWPPPPSQRVAILHNRINYQRAFLQTSCQFWRVSLASLPAACAANNSTREFRHEQNRLFFPSIPFSPPPIAPLLVLRCYNSTLCIARRSPLVTST